MLANHFGLRLKYLRKIRNRTQAQLAQAADISVPYLGRVERGLSSPSFEIIQKISEALETEPANLFLPPGRGSADDENRIDEGAASPLTAPFSCTCWTRFGALLWELPDGDEHWSREFWQLLGYGDRARKTASTELLLRHVRQEQRTRVAAALQHARRGNPVNDLEFLLVRKDGECRDVLLHLDVVRDSRGAPRSLHGTAMDITEWRQLHDMLMVNQKELEAYVRERTTDLALTVADLKKEMAARERAEGALRQSEAKYRLLAEHSSDVIWTMNVRHEIDYISPSVRRLYGYTPEEYARIPLERHLSDESCQRIRGAMAQRQQSMRAGAPDTSSYRFELQHYTASGQSIWVDIVSTPMVDEQGTIQGFVGITRGIDARKRAEIALRDLSRLMRGMADNLPDLVWAKDLEGRFLFVNQVMCDMLLKAEDTQEPQGKTDLYFAQRERTAGHEHTFGEVCVNSDEVTLRTLEPGRFLEDGLVRGEYLALDVHKAPFYDAGGALIGTVGAGRDVTAELAKSKALRRSVAMLEEAQRISCMGSWDNDLRGGDVVWSDEIFRLLGYAPGEVAPCHERFREHLHPEDKERVVAAIESSRASGAPCSIECRILRKDGEIRSMQLKAEVLLDDAGRPVRSQGTMRDITERRRMEQALRESEERFRQLFMKAPLPYQSLDAKGNFLDINQIFLDVLGYSRDEVIGRNFGEFLHPDYADHFKTNFPRFKAVGEVLGIEFEMVKKDGSTILVSFHGKIQSDTQGRFQRTHCIFQDITESRRLEEEIKFSKTRLELAAEGGDLGLWYWRVDLDRAQVSDYWLKLKGLTRVEYNQSVDQWYNGLHPDDRERATALLDQHLKGETERFDTEYRFFRPNYGWYWEQASAKVIERDDKGNPVLMVGYHKDITERRRLEEDLRLYTKRLESLHAMSQMADSDERDITNLALEAIVELTASDIGYIFYMNEEETELILHSWSAKVMEQCAVRDIQTVYKVAETGLWGEAVRQRKPIITNDYAASPYRRGCPEGHVPITRHLNIPVFQGQRIVALAGVANKVQDYCDDDVRIMQLVMNGMWGIIRRKRSEQALRESEDRLKSILGTMPDFVSIVDRNHTLVWANSACFESFGPDILHRRCYEVFNGGKGEPCPDCVGRTTFENGRPNTLERAVHLSDGRQRFFSWMSAPLGRDEDGGVTRILHVGRDITDFRQAIVDLEQAKSDAEAATRAKSHFLAAMSHDLRTPLNGALGMLQLLQATGLEPEQNEYLDNAILAARNLLTLINEILDLAKVEAGRMEVLEHEFSPRAFLENELRVLKAQAELKGLRFVLEVENDVPQAVLTDQIRLGQILQNLVGNALKFTHQGELRVSCAALPGEGDARTLRFCVADTGPGISENLRDKLFTPFVQGQEGKTAVKGSGLGLSIVKRLVELLGGDIEVHSTPNKGARFIFTIRARVSPLARRLSDARAEVAATMVTATVAASADAPREEHAAHSHKKVVLLVEDDDINRLAAERMLCSLGHAVLAASDGARALDILREREVDLVLMDVRLPLLDGLAATQAIRDGAGGEKNARIPIVALTALAMDGDRERCLEAGMDEYLAKPVEMPALREALERFLAPERRKTARHAPAHPAEHADD